MDLERTRRVRIYLSGPIFSQAEIEWARRVKGLIEKSFASRVEVIWPHEIASGPPENIFRENLRVLDQCPIVVAILDGPQVDDGTAWEVGYHYARGGKVLGIRTDFRKAGEGPESWANAMVEFSCICIVSSIDQLILKLNELLET
ncbi:MAG TPA: nucleoside 2-deoxyribosyltransferase [Methanotrichaceae archaeon]|nr:nucleoside 2-deoxyribosyltransferase [Methanotrichaceae archaeon]